MLSFFVIAMDMFVKTLTSREDPLFSPFVIADNLILLSIFSSIQGQFAIGYAMKSRESDKVW